MLDGRARYAVIEGDCRDVMRGMADRSVAHVICDPPYEAEAHTKQRRVKRGDVVAVEPLPFPPMTAEDRIEVGAALGRLVQRWALVFCQVEAAMLWANSATMPRRRSPKDPALDYVRTCIWNKPDGQPQLTGDRPAQGYEAIVALHASGAKRWNGGGRRGVFTHSARWSGGTPHDHPSEKPYRLMEELVSLFTDPDDVILDPFAGSGTTGVAALRLGRRVILIEKDAKYAALCRDRMAAEAAGSTLQAARAGQLALLGGGK